MSRDERARPAGTKTPDEVSFGSSRPRSRWWPGWLLMVAGVAVIAVVVVTHVGHPSKPHGSRPDGRQPLVAVSEAGHRLLGVRAWRQLLAYGADQVTRIQLARGRITRTAVPPLQSTGADTFVACPSQAIIRPQDFVPGYLVPDGHSARRLRGALAGGGPAVVPGPRPGQVWVQAGYQASSLSLAWMDGRGTAVSMLLPPRGPWLAASDGRGYALAFNIGSGGDAGEVYDVRPGGYRRIDGSVAAVGPTRWLTVRCHRRRCSNVVIDPATGARRTLPGRPAQAGQSPGVIAPDGVAAAVFRSAAGEVTLHLINLESGADQRVLVPVDQGYGTGQTLAWSPDSRWLFVVAAHARLAVVNASTGKVQGIGVGLPPVSQIVIRSGRR